MTRENDSGLLALVLLLRMNGITAEAEQVRHSIGVDTIGITEMLRCARNHGLKARTIKTNWARLARTPLPAIAALADGAFLILGNTSDDKALIQRPPELQPEAMSKTDFEDLWDGHLVLMARRASLSDLS